MWLHGTNRCEGLRAYLKILNFPQHFLEGYAPRVTYALTLIVTVWAVKAYTVKRLMWVLRRLRNAMQYIMKFTCISICLEIKLLRLAKFEHVRNHAVVKTRSISIHTFQSYTGNGQRDRQTDERTDNHTDIYIKCSLKSHLIKR